MGLAMAPRNGEVFQLSCRLWLFRSLTGEQNRRFQGRVRPDKSESIEMKAVFVSVIIAILILIFVWKTYPSSLPARTYVSKQLSADEYADIKDVLFSFAASNAAYGVSARGAPGPEGIVTLYCREVPLVIVFQGPEVTLMQVMHGAEQRTPSLGPVINHVLSKMSLIPQPEWRDEDSAGYVNRLLLKYRDGIDLDAMCAS